MMQHVREGFFNQAHATPLRRGPIAALDVGTSKTACLIAEYNDDGNHNNFIRVLGFGQQPSTGMKQGQVIDMHAAENDIRSAVDMAERMAKLEVRRAYVGISAGRLSNYHFDVPIALAGAAVTPQHIGQARQIADEHFRSEEDRLLHVIPISYSIDDTKGITDPTGMVGTLLTVHLYLMSAPISPIRNLLSCIAQGHLECEVPVAIAYASALATLTQDEKDLGALHIDMGGGTCNVSIFYGGEPIFSAVIPIGGHHVTTDIARGLNISVAAAERIKKRFGSALSDAGHGREQFELPTEEGDHRILPCGDLTRIIRPRMEEMFEHIGAHIAQYRPDAAAIRRVVLTGGASKLSGVPEIAEMVLKKQPRLAVPIHISGLPNAAAEADYAACVGLLHYAARNPVERILSKRSGRYLFSRLGHWVRRNF